MPAPFWPLADLVLRTADVVLRPVCEADLAELSETFPADVELDPAAPRLALDDEHTVRGAILHQDYWRGVGTWRPEAWRLKFAVRAAGRLVGQQELEGNDFPALRTVDTASYLVPDVRGQGLGRQMRRAVLALAFGPLEAQAAITEAWHDNHASLAVSRRLGYRPNGESLHRRGDAVDVMVHLRLARADWLAGGGATDVVVTGFEPCLPWFGLA